MEHVEDTTKDSDSGYTDNESIILSDHDDICLECSRPRKSSIESSFVLCLYFELDPHYFPGMWNCWDCSSECWGDTNPICHAFLCGPCISKYSNELLKEVAELKSRNQLLTLKFHKIAQEYHKLYVEAEREQRIFQKVVQEFHKLQVAMDRVKGLLINEQ
jgi:hypothetical protein